MQEPPPDLDPDLLAPALRRFGIAAVSIDYAPVGFGDHHWAVSDTAARRWFVTLADLREKPEARLRAALGTAAALAERDRLRFVVAPLPTPGGDTLVPLAGRWALTVYPFLDGQPGAYDRPLDPPARAAVLDLLVTLHTRRPPGSTPVIAEQPGGRAALDTALRELDVPWAGGPFSEPARELLNEHAGAVRARLAAFDELAAATRWLPRVVTHGEPHPGNLVRGPRGWNLVDWDTVGLAPAERDLWRFLATVPDADRAALLDRHAAGTGRAPDAAALTFYGWRWDVDDLGQFLARFRGPHRRSADVLTAWAGLRRVLERAE